MTRSGRPMSMVRITRFVAKDRRRARSSARARLAPALEALEGRTLLSTLVVTNNQDSGDGSLRAEIQAASPGDTIVFANDLRGETITLTSGPLEVAKSLVIDGPGASQLTVSGGGNSGVFLVDGDGTAATIEGLTIADGRADFGAGIQAVNVSLEVDDCLITRNVANVFGGGIAQFGGRLVIRDTTFTDNSAANVGGAIFTGQFQFPGPLGSLDISGSTFDGNSTGDFGSGGGIAGAADVTVTDTAFHANRAGTGGAINLFDGQSSVEGSTFDGNVAVGFGGAISFGPQPGATLRVADSRFTANLAGTPGTGIGAGGAIANSSQGLTVESSTFSLNRAKGDTALGGAIWGGFFSGATITDSQFSGNVVDGVAEAAGGAVHSDAGSSLTVAGSRFESNLATGTVANISGGAINFSGFTGFGGALAVSDSTFVGNRAVGQTPEGSPFGASAQGGAINATGDASIRGSTFDGNQAVGGDGGAGGNGGLAGGGAIEFQSFGSTLDVASSTFRGNQAIGGSNPSNAGPAFGGAIDAPFSGSTVNITDSRFQMNQAVGGDGGASSDFWGNAQGGALSTGGATVNIDDTQFVNNAALGGDGTNGSDGHDGQGGALSLTGGTTTVTNSKFSANRAVGGKGAVGGDGDGGAIYTLATLTIVDSSITGNKALGGPGGQGFGGGIDIAGGSTSLKNTKVVGNKATTAGDNIYGTPS